MNLQPSLIDQAQRDAIKHDLQSTILVEAAAGTGKTTSMIDRMVNLLAEGHLKIDTLAAVTFTRKAAAEIRARFQVGLEQAAREASGDAQMRLLESLSHIDRCFIGTIHSFCGRILRERPVEAGVDIHFTEVTFNRLPSTFRSDPHCFVVIAIRATRSKRITQPEVIFF